MSRPEVCEPFGLADAELPGLVGIRAEGPAVEGMQELVEGVERVGPAAGHADGGEGVVVDGPRRGQGGEQARRRVDGFDVGVAAALPLKADRVQVGDVVAASEGVDVGVEQALAVMEGRILDELGSTAVYVGVVGADAVDEVAVGGE